MREINTEIYQLSVIASQMVSFERAELVQKVRDEYDTFGPMLMKLAEGGETLKALAALITAAETRLAVVPGKRRT